MLSAPCLTLVLLPNIHCRLTTKLCFCSVEKMRVRLFSSFIFIIWAIDTSLNAYAANADVQQNSDSLLCRRCGHDITYAAKLDNRASKLALRQRNDTILGVQQCLVQLFRNPQGQHFELITATSANVKPHGEAFEEHSWFPGYAWRLAVCPQCGAHVGWSFETPHQSDRHDSENRWQHSHDHVKEDKSSKKPYSFVGLIYPNLIQEQYADSLIITPKAYKS
ncbi:uncharacterized protein LOC114948308 [Acropora millepora]|uniref:uncharacterized protein LOC114948308 n=1 Tax=Acropora millepora TaxID=45264 RepID=UPI001CF4862D|nr:uncharacterized protein LOC114948308 [Acropora millepora]